MAEPERAKGVGIPNRRVDEMSRARSERTGERSLTAFEFRDELQGMLGWADDELASLPILYGDQLRMGDIYLDLDHPGAGEFRATRQSTINPGCRYVPKQGVPDQLWYRLAVAAESMEAPSGNGSPVRGSFGRPNPEDVAPGHAGMGAPGVGTEVIEIEMEQEKSS